MKAQAIKTSYQLNKEANDLAVYNEFNALMEQPGAMITAVNQHLMKKYGIHATSTIWTIRKRVKKAINTQMA